MDRFWATEASQRRSDECRERSYGTLLGLVHAHFAFEWLQNEPDWLQVAHLLAPNGSTRATRHARNGSSDWMYLQIGCKNQCSNEIQLLG